jgi:hypothetical protein
MNSNICGPQLFDGDWRTTWVDLLDGLNANLERKVGWVSPAALRRMEVKVRAIGAEWRMQL